MVFRGRDGKACRGNCYKSKGESIFYEWDQQRRSLFKNKVLFVEYDGVLYWLRMSPGYPEHNGYWSIGSWFPGDKDNARQLIDAAFSTLQAIAKRGGHGRWTKTLSLLQ